MTKSRNNSSDINDITTDVAVLLSKVGGIEEDVREIKGKLERDYVTQDQFEPIKKIVYGLVSIVLTSVVGAILLITLK